MVAEVVDANDLPEFQPLRVGAKKKYPWLTLLPGQGFRFDADIPLAGARSQVAKAQNLPGAAGRRFIVRLDVHGVIWAIRLDGLPLERREAWRKRAALPQGGEDISDEQFGQMRDAGAHVVDVPGDPGEERHIAGHEEGPI